MTVPATKRLFNTVEFEQMGRSGILTEDDRVELIEGEILSMAPIGSEHASKVDRLARALQRGVRTDAIVRIQNPILLGESSEPQPDLAVVRYQEDFYAGAHPGPDNIFLLVEVAETSLEYDREVKLPLYAKWGISTVWLVNLLDRELAVYEQPQGERYERRHIAADHETLTVPAVPSCKVTVSEILGKGNRA